MQSEALTALERWGSALKGANWSKDIPYMSGYTGNLKQICVLSYAHDKDGKSKSIVADSLELSTRHQLAHASSCWRKKWVNGQSASFTWVYLQLNMVSRMAPERTIPMSLLTPTMEGRLQMNQEH